MAKRKPKVSEPSVIKLTIGQLKQFIKEQIENNDSITADSNLDVSNMKELGHGSTRQVYLSSRGTVYKVAGEDGLVQNKVEIFLSGKSPILARIISSSPNGSWIEMERLDTQKTSILKAWKKNGISHDDLISFEFRHEDFTNSDNEIMIELVRLREDFNLQDVAEITNWGVDTSGNPKILDYGFIGQEHEK